MRPFELLSRLRSLGVEVWADGDRLRYNAPKGVLTPELRDLLVAHKADILAFLHKATPSHPALPPIPLAPRGGPLPLSFAQQRLWFLDQLTPGASGYHIPGAVRLKGRLDVAALRRSLDAVVARHEILRTTFAIVDDQPLQVIVSLDNIALPVEDLRHLPAGERDAALHQRVVAEQRPFDLAHGPLVRALLLQFADDEYVALFTLHHIITDMWSMGILIQDLAALYIAQVTGQPAQLAALPLQYADFAVWQREWLQGEVLERQMSYWREQLGGELPMLELPLDRPRPPVQTFAGSIATDVVARPLTAALLALSQREGATLFMTLLAAFQMLLARYSGQEDILVGSPIAGRTRTEIEPLIGFFVNTLVLRSDLAGNPPFRKLLGRVRELTLAAYAHQDLPFEMLVEALRPERDLSRTPVFQVMFTLQNTPMRQIELPGLRMELVEVASGLIPIDLNLQITEQGGELKELVEYNTDLFEATTIRRLLGHFHTLLEGIAANPEQPIGRLPLLTAGEQHQLVVEWNDSAADFPRDSSFVALFEAQAARFPERVAASYEQQQISYAALNARANQLAHYLGRLGVGPDTLVGLCVERSLAMLVGMLGILKAGGAYLPLDPGYPQERLTYMLEDSGVPVVLTFLEQRTKNKEQNGSLEPRTKNQEPTVEDSGSQFSVLGSGVVVDLERDWGRIAREPATNPNIQTDPDQRAYVIYTSGSTGRPKGVMVRRHGLLNLCYGLRPFFDDPQVEQTGLITSISFDISVSQIFPTLLFGRTLHIIPDEVKLESAVLLRFIQEHCIQLLDGVPSHFQAVLNDLAPRVFQTDLRYLLIGGEKLETRLLEAIFTQLGEAVIVGNIYGLTEISDINAFSLVRVGDQHEVITVGWPFQNNRIYLTSPYGALQPIGVIGEVCVSGESLSRGYLNRPELTAEKFVPCEFEHGALMCRTGDLGRRLPDGRIVILGRGDQQVKVRGFRIELGEIEALLLRHPAVREGVVVTRPDANGDARLVAYLVPHQEPAAEDGGSKIEDGISDGTGQLSSILHPPSSIPGELRSFLLERLPGYMVPATYVLLDQLPRTPNGKIDRRALPDPSEAESGTDQAFVAPRTPTEEVLAAIWASVLDQPRVSVEDSFFDLGGHSLLATQLIARTRAAFNVNLSVRAVFEHPTVRSLAAALERTRREVLPPIAPAPRSGPLPLSFAQQRLWFLAQLAPENASYNIPIALRLIGMLDSMALQASLDALVARHESLRTHFALVDGEPIQVIAPAPATPLEQFDLRALPPPERETQAQKLLHAAATQPFDLARGPLLRTLLVRVADQQHLALLTFHHIVFDGWSTGVLIRELAALYGAALAQEPPDLPPLPIQYADFAVWQRDWLQAPGERAESPLQAQLAYWRQQLAGLPVLELPTDYPRPPVQTFPGAIETIVLAPALLAALQELSRQAGVTLFMTTLAAFQLLLARYSGQSDIVVGTPIAGRTRLELEGLIGFFVNTLVLRTELAGVLTVRDLLARVRATTLEAYAHQDVPFELLVDTLQPARDLSRTPLVQVMFTLQNAQVFAEERPELRIEPVEVETVTAKFDLTLGLQEVADGLHAQVEYNTDLFAPATIARLLRHFGLLLEAFAADPGQRIDAVPLLTADERQIVLADWNATTQPYPFVGCVQELVATQARQRPGALAVDDGVQQLSYGQLDARANQLAHLLQRRGIGPERCVALLLERSADLVVAALAVLKAGGAYVPLDPALPPARLAFLLEDSRAAVLITKEIRDWRLEINGPDNLQSLISNLPSASVIDLGRDLSVIAQMPDIAPVSRVAPDNLAYAIYTSGSTGNPKGVMISQRGLLNLVYWHQQAFGLTAQDRATVLAGVGFDAAVWETWPYLTCGASLHLPTEDVRGEPERLRDWLLAQAITVSFVPTPLTAALLALPWPQGGALRYLLTGGDRLHQPPPSGLPFTLVNNYGPTENSVVTTSGSVPPAAASPALLPTIGRPIANTQVYVLDARMQPAPIGIPGELYIAGVGVARGYLHRPDLTAERFLPNPFSDFRFGILDFGLADAASSIHNPKSKIQNGERLYRTGDRVRYRADGTIEFLGRIDQQVKIRGYRIELGEIEATLLRHPSVREALVLARNPDEWKGADMPGDVRLVAYLAPTTDDRRPTTDSPDTVTRRQAGKVTGSEEAITVSPLHPVTLSGPLVVGEVRVFLKERLPDYMIPAAFVLLDALPRTPNGKIDRRALPAPEAETLGAGGAYVAPRTPVEQRVAELTGQILGLERVSIHANFFELGGHSLLATRLVVRLREEYAVELLLRNLFETPTVAGLAEHIEALQWAAQEELLPDFVGEEHQEGEL